MAKALANRRQIYEKMYKLAISLTKMPTFAALFDNLPQVFASYVLRYGEKSGMKTWGPQIDNLK